MKKTLLMLLIPMMSFTCDKECEQDLLQNAYSLREDFETVKSNVTYQNASRRGPDSLAQTGFGMNGRYSAASLYFQKAKPVIVDIVDQELPSGAVHGSFNVSFRFGYSPDYGTTTATMLLIPKAGGSEIVVAQYQIPADDKQDQRMIRHVHGSASVPAGIYTVRVLLQTDRAFSSPLTGHMVFIDDISIN